MLTYRLAGTTEEIRGPTGTNRAILRPGPKSSQPHPDRTDDANLRAPQ
jgi:hypothetical protein